MQEHSLDERYEIKTVLGKGGMGVVYKAHDNILKIDVAIKMLRSDLMGQAAIRLQREAIAAGKLQNANIARIYDFGQTKDDTPYMVMELVDGKSLAQLIQEIAALPFETAIDIFMQICRGLEHAHSNGIVHRDLKPSNVMLIEQENGTYLVKLLDFGVAKIETDHKITSEGSIIGSPLYMSPEQVETSSVDFRSDIYSLGCLMFESLSGKPPFKGETAIETMTMHKKNAPALLSEITQSALPEELVKLVDRCLQKTPQARPSSAQTIELELKNILHPVSSIKEEEERVERKEFRPDTETEKLHTKLPKSTVFAIGGTLTLAAVIALGLSYSSFQKKEKAQLEEATKSVTISKPPGQNDLDNEFNANPNFEFTHIDGMPVHLAKKHATDEDLKDLVKTNYPVLKIKKGRISGTGLRYLTKMDLEWLEIRNPLFKCENVKYLKSLKKLKKYVMSVPELNDANLKEIAEAKSLETIIITVGDITDKGVSYLTKLPNLKRLEISFCPKVSADIGKTIATIETLDYFTPPCMQSNQSLRAIQKKAKIKNIGLDGLYLKGKDLETICSILQPETLCLSNFFVTDNDFSGLQKLSKLKMLDLNHSREIAPALLKELGQLKVPDIDFSNSCFDSKQLQLLLLNPHLKKIDCNFCHRINKSDMDKFVKNYKAKWNKDIEAIKLDIDQNDLNVLQSRPFEIDIR